MVAVAATVCAAHLTLNFQGAPVAFSPSSFRTSVCILSGASGHERSKRPCSTSHISFCGGSRHSWGSSAMAALPLSMCVALMCSSPRLRKHLTSTRSGSVEDKKVSLQWLQDVGNVQDSLHPIWEDNNVGGKLDELFATGPEVDLGTPANAWPGLWRVVHAPHMKTLGSLALTKFDVYYDIFLESDKLRLRSFVRFNTPFGGGWLNSAGTVKPLENEVEVPQQGLRPTTEVDFTDFWVDLGAKLPREAPAPSDDWMQQVARPFFFKQLSIFPTLLFDPETGLCAFYFPPLGVKIVAKRITPAELRPFLA